MTNKELLINLIETSHNFIKESYLKKNYNEIYLIIYDYTKTLDISFKQRIWHYLNDINTYVLCKECNKNRVSFNTSIKKGYKNFCSVKCSSNNKFVRNKYKETVKEKYGVDHYSKTTDFLDKYKQTNLEKYGVDNYSKTNEYLKKSKESYLNNYEIEHPMKLSIIKEKVKQTNLERYGVEYPMKHDDVKRKTRQTNLERYGVDSYSKTREFAISVNKTNNEKYKANSITESEKFRKSNYDIAKDENYIKLLNNKISLLKCDNNKNHTYEISSINYKYRKDNDLIICTICYPINEHKSLKEIELFNYIKSIYNGDIISGYKDKFEIDIYLPNENIGFEFNGIYWHSNKFINDENYHINKTNFFKTKNIKIIHIWEDDWLSDKNNIKKYIENIILNENYSYNVYENNNEIMINKSYPSIINDKYKFIKTTKPELEYKIFNNTIYEIYNCGYDIYQKI